jgi:hypothetical protein
MEGIVITIFINYQWVTLIIQYDKILGIDRISTRAYEWGNHIMGKL